MSFNVGFRPMSFGQNNNKVNQPLAGKIAPLPQRSEPKLPTTPTPLAGLIAPPKSPQPKTPTSIPPLAGIVSVPPKPNNQPSYPIPPLAGLIAPPDKKLPNPIIENIKKPE